MCAVRYDVMGWWDEGKLLPYSLACSPSLFGADGWGEKSHSSCMLAQAWEGREGGAANQPRKKGRNSSLEGGRSSERWRDFFGVSVRGSGKGAFSTHPSSLSEGAFLSLVRAVSESSFEYLHHRISCALSQHYPKWPQFLHKLSCVYPYFRGELRRLLPGLHVHLPGL